MISTAKRKEFRPSYMMQLLAEPGLLHWVHWPAEGLSITTWVSPLNVLFSQSASSIQLPIFTPLTQTTFIDIVHHSHSETFSSFCSLLSQALPNLSDVFTVPPRNLSEPSQSSLSGFISKVCTIPVLLQCLRKQVHPLKKYLIAQQYLLAKLKS